MSEAGFNRFAVLGDPSLTPEALVTHYRENEAGMRGSIALIVTLGSFWAMYTAGISRQLARIPGINPTVVWAQLGNGIIGGMCLMIPAVLFASTIYRLDRNPEVTQLMSDTAWFSIFLVFPPFAAQELLISYGILSDRRPDPLCPHWIAWVNNGFVLGYFPAFGVHCVYRGVLAWNGALNFWVGLRRNPIETDPTIEEGIPVEDF
ncbi:hypothetical protein G7Y79_00006g018940 [Physcia stellaris]|nr:hypothetical protein G7Y79_00006g018940 [Physcia stellaris]